MARTNRKFGWHSGTLFTKDAKILGDLYIQETLNFSDVSAGALSVTGSIELGNSTTALSFSAYSSKAITVYTTCSATDGSNTATPVYVHCIYTGAGQVGRCIEANLETNVAMGGWMNAIKGYTEFTGTSGRTTGLASSVCAEMKLPNATLASGQYYPLEIEMEAQASTVLAGTTGAGGGFIYAKINGTAADFEDKAGFFWLNGVTAGSGNILSAGSITVRCFVAAAMTARYLVLSSAEDSLTMAGNISQSGATTFGTGTGAVSLNGDVTIAAGKTLYMRDASQSIASSADDNMELTSPTLTLVASTALGITTPSLTVGTSGTDVVIFSAKLASQLYHNLSGQSYTVLKIHNHATTAEIGGLETKGELINTTGSVVGEQASWSYAPTGLTGTPDGVSASSNVLAIAASHTVTTGNIYALVGEAQLYGTLNGASVNVAGVIGVVGGNGANTQVLHMAGVQSAMSTGLVNPTTGTLSHFLANSLSTVVVDNLICMQDSEYITNFAYFNAAATDKCVEANTGTPAGAVINIIRVDIAGTPGYIPVYAGKFS